MENDKKPLPCGLLSPDLDWTPEQRAAVQPKPESNVIVLDDYRPRK
jgi:hypothetical protein